MSSDHMQRLRDDLTQSDVRELLDYNPETGSLSYRPRSAKWFADGQGGGEKQCEAWNRRYVGTEAFTRLNNRGYPCGRFLSKMYAAHRLIWFWVHGEWPALIDHINRNRTDNRLCNLRAATPLINARNRAFPRRVDSEDTGIVKRGHGTFAAFASHGDKCLWLGSWETIEEARAARAAAVQVLDVFVRAAPDGFAAPASDRSFHAPLTSDGAPHNHG